MCLGTFLRLRRSLFYNLPRRLLRRTFALQMYDNACDIYIVRRSAHPRKLACFCCIGDSNGISYTAKTAARRQPLFFTFSATVILHGLHCFFRAF